MTSTLGIEDQPTTEQILTPQGEHLLKGLSDAFARGEGLAVNFSVNPNADTFFTSCSVDEKGIITVGLSPKLLERAEAEDRLDFLGFAVLHETGHVTRFQAHAPKAGRTPKDQYFNNIVDDIAINYDNSKRTRFVHEMTKRAYDRYLYPVDERQEISKAPKHKQFMESLLTLSMTTDAHTREDVPTLLQEANLTGLDQEVVAAIADVLAHKQNGSTFNLLKQLRTYGSDLSYTRRVNQVIRQHFDGLYEEDQSEQSKGEGGGTSGGGEGFDYSDSAGCGQNVIEKSGNTKPKSDQTDKAEGSDSEEIDPDNPEPLDISAIAKEIAGQIEQVLPEARSAAKDAPRNLTPEQLAKLKAELKLDDEDFAGYMKARSEYAGEINALTDLLLQLRHERQNAFLAPGREVAARGSRIKVDRLVRAIASASLGDQPDIWKHPSIMERTEHEFDGLDFYLLCDVSSSMQGEKAESAASASVVLEEGLFGASSQMAGEHEPVVRLQIQAFGAGHKMLCKLTDNPSLQDLGRTFNGLRNPNSGSTQISGALEAIDPTPGRLSVVAVVSDGDFHDKDLAISAGHRLAGKNVAIIQLVFGGAGVGKLADNAHRIELSSARDLTSQLFNIMPDLIETLRRSTHA